jgi:hypothetical protein
LIGTSHRKGTYDQPFTLQRSITKFTGATNCVKSSHELLGTSQRSRIDDPSLTLQCLIIEKLARMSKCFTSIRDLLGTSRHSRALEKGSHYQDIVASLLRDSQTLLREQNGFVTATRTFSKESRSPYMRRCIARIHFQRLSEPDFHRIILSGTIGNFRPKERTNCFLFLAACRTLDQCGTNTIGDLPDSSVRVVREMPNVTKGIRNVKPRIDIIPIFPYEIAGSHHPFQGGERSDITPFEESRGPLGNRVPDLRLKKAPKHPPLCTAPGRKNRGHLQR